MCGREPNFELSEEDKEELRKLSWEEYLAITRSEISSKSKKRTLTTILSLNLRKLVLVLNVGSYECRTAAKN